MLAAFPETITPSERHSCCSYSTNWDTHSLPVCPGFLQPIIVNHFGGCFSFLLDCLSTQNQWFVCQMSHGYSFASFHDWDTPIPPPAQNFYHHVFSVQGPLIAHLPPPILFLALRNRSCLVQVSPCVLPFLSRTLSSIYDIIEIIC